MQFPIGIFGVAIAIATLPVVSRHASQGDMGALKATYVSSLTMAFLLTIPAAFGLAVLAKPIIRLIFEHGHFHAVDTLRTSEALIYYSVGLFAYSTVKITVPVFYALRDTKYPVIASFFAVVTNVLIVSLTLNAFQHKAIALSTSITMIVNFCFLSAVLYRKVGGYDLRYLVGAFIKITLASAAMGLLAYYLYRAASLILDQRLLLNQMLALFLVMAAAVLVYFALIRLLGIKEYHEVVESLKKRFLGSGGGPAALSD
jgi:putative peptidoglycan lipid II flippase